MPEQPPLYQILPYPNGFGFRLHGPAASSGILYHTAGYTIQAVRRGYALADGARVELYDAKRKLKQSMAVTSEKGWVKYR